jgi:hypothetical protein
LHWSTSGSRFCSCFVWHILRIDTYWHVLNFESFWYNSWSIPTRLRSCLRSFVQKQQRRWDFGLGNRRNLSRPLETRPRTNPWTPTGHHWAPCFAPSHRSHPHPVTWEIWQ